MPGDLVIKSRFLRREGIEVEVTPEGNAYVIVPTPLGVVYRIPVEEQTALDRLEVQMTPAAKRLLERAVQKVKELVRAGRLPASSRTALRLG